MPVPFLLRALAALGLALALLSSALASTSAPRQLWQLVDYVGVDYREAVEDGKVINEGEYAEMREFTASAQQLAQKLPAHAQNATLLASLAQLRAAVERKASPDDVARIARQANALLMASHPIDSVPGHAIDIKAGAALYQQHCASCHGASGGGDGPAGKGLDPAPIAFTDVQRAGSRSLLALYQAITQGVAGTGMPAFASLSDAERWNMAFYIGTLSHDSASAESGRSHWQRDSTWRQQIDGLTALTTVTERELAAARDAEEAGNVIAFLRLHPETLTQAKQQRGFALTKERLQASLAALESGQNQEAMRLALSAYLDGFEPLEAALAASDQRLMVRIEDRMLAYRHALSTGDLASARLASQTVLALLNEAEDTLQRSAGDFTTAFLGALTILLREGLEALLIIIGMLTFLRRSNQPQAVKAVHAGWASALVAGVATWAVATYAVSISGASREVTEGLSSLFAAVVLLGVGLWMHQKSAAGRWQSYLQAHLTSALSKRSYWALFALAFVAVYREVFETVLFFSALSADGNGTGVAMGFAVAVLLLAVMAWVLLKTSARMPVGQFFSISAVVVAVLAVVLAGKGLAGLQEAGWIGVTPVPLLRVELLGVYPSLQTVMGQVLVAVIALLGFTRNRFQARSAVSA